MLGPWVNGAAVVAGGLAGAGLGQRLPERFRARMVPVLGIAALGIGVLLTAQARTLPAVVLSLLLGTGLGELVNLEAGIERLAVRARGLVERVAPRAHGRLSHQEFLEQYVALGVLFCASGTGIFGSLREGMTGDPTLLLVKSLLDLVTAALFAASLGGAVALLALPQLLVQLGLYGLAAVIAPLTTPVLLADLSACAGLLLLATGLRIAGVKPFPVASMLPALLLAMPVSALWLRWVGAPPG